MHLILGVSAVAFVLGYMAGGSTTPVVSAVIPALFGLVVSGVSLLGTSITQRRIDALKGLTDGKDKDAAAAATKVMRQLRRGFRVELRHQSRFLGLVLLSFSTLYLVGSIVGTTARTRSWFASSPAKKELPWTAANSPTSSSAALYWVTLQEKMRAWGYTEPQVQQIYSIFTSEFARAASATRPSPIDPSIPAENPALFKLREIAGQEFPFPPEPKAAQSGAPYAGNR